MKLKALDILNAYEALAKLADKALDLQTACTIAKNLRELAVTKEVIDKKRTELIHKYAEKNADGTPVQEGDGVKITDVPSFMQHMNELLASETEITLSFISKSALSEIKISPKDILSLTNLLKEDETTCTQ